MQAIHSLVKARRLVLLCALAAAGCVTVNGGDSGSNTSSGNTSGSDSERCLANQQCSCTGTNCQQDCESSEGACQFSCDADRCEATCDGGGCQMNCDGDVCILNCAGGGCNLTCGNGTSECRIQACDSMCALACNGAGVCENSCAEVPGLCSTTP